MTITELLAERDALRAQLAKAERERDEVGIQLTALRERCAKLERVADAARALRDAGLTLGVEHADGALWRNMDRALLDLDAVPGDDGVPG